MDDDHTDVEGAVVEGGLFQDLYHRPDGVVAAQVVVQPQLVQPTIPVAGKKLDSGSACTGHLRAAAIDE